MMTQERLVPSRRFWTLSLATCLLLAAVWHPAAAHEPNDSAAVAGRTEKISDTWSRTVPIAGPKPDSKIGVWRVWVEEGWLVAERRTNDDKIEWKIVLAKVVGDETPEIEANRIDALRLIYRDGRYFICDHNSGDAKTEFGCLYCRRQRKTDEEHGPELTIPPRDSNLFRSFHGLPEWSLGGQVSDSWLTVTAGPAKEFKQLWADCLVRLFHTDLEVRDHGGSGGGGFLRAQYGKWFVEDDGELLVANRQEAWLLSKELESRAKDDPVLASRLATRKLGGAPAPELSGDAWLNVERPPTLKSLRGKAVLLVLFDLKQPTFMRLLPPLLGFQRDYAKQGLEVIGVYTKAPAHEIAEHLADEGITFPVLIDDGKIGERYGIGYSACVLIDREGKVVSVYKDSLAPPAEIETLLEKSKDAAD